MVWPELCCAVLCLADVATSNWHSVCLISCWWIFSWYEGVDLTASTHLYQYQYVQIATPQLQCLWCIHHTSVISVALLLSAELFSGCAGKGFPKLNAFFYCLCDTWVNAQRCWVIYCITFSAQSPAHFWVDAARHMWCSWQRHYWLLHLHGNSTMLMLQIMMSMPIATAGFKDGTAPCFVVLHAHVSCNTVM